MDVTQILKAKDTFELRTNPTFKSDSLVIVKRKTIIDPSKYATNNKFDIKTLNRYRVSVFYYTNSKTNHTYYAKQWNVPILIYIDKSFPKQLKKSLKQFLSVFDSVDNLNISITSNINKANYYVKPTKKLFTNNSYKFENEIDKKKFAFNNGDYTILSSGDEKIKGCILELNTHLEVDIKILENNLKQLFFLSLGRFFVIHRDKDISSYLCPTYQFQDHISPSDLNILKMHYNYIYEFPVSDTEFSKLTKLKQ
ncbi:hypothetical protein [uncultured Psychroserpens sp.]|uniref:hypothetical protein n=1 Tax=uncultured Psychroserpens sp. TaxID=255436 RepID=UPI0026281C40|nr:hypothetical protein [uncultured Psychroserpens sp.]